MTLVGSRGTTTETYNTQQQKNWLQMLLSYQGPAYSYVVVGGTIAGANGAGAAASCVGPTNNSTVNDN